MKHFLFLLFFFSCFCCTTLKQEPKVEVNPIPSSFNAVVGTVGTDCGGSYLLYLRSLIDQTLLYPQPFYEINLPDTLKIEGLKIEIDYRTPKGEEWMICTTLGPGYDQLFIISAKKAE